MHHNLCCGQAWRVDCTDIKYPWSSVHPYSSHMVLHSACKWWELLSIAVVNAARLRCCSYICVLRGRYDLQQSLLVVKKCVHSALDKIVSIQYVYLVGINWDHELFCLLSNFCGDPSGTLVSIDEVRQCHYVYWHAALNTCLLSSEVWVACGVSLTQTMDERQCVTGWWTDCIRDAMYW